MPFAVARVICAVLFALLALRTLIVSACSPASRDTSLSAAAEACQQLQDLLPELVSFPGDEQFAEDVDHWLITSTQNATCAVEPEGADDVSRIINIIANLRTPFAIKSAGHAYNPGFSSTTGVQISMARFRNVSYNAENETLSVGVGLSWGEVYERIEPFNVMVAGGRINSIGVGGFSLGGGYSWKTNQYGLLIDTVVSYELVLPSGKIVRVTNESYPDLFFGLKGGLNNFGIVTEITLEAHPQTEVFGGQLVYSPDVLEDVKLAITNFTYNNTDPKAQMEAPIMSTGNSSTAAIYLFYDGPTPPIGIYDEILSIPTTYADVKTRTFVDFMNSLDKGATYPSLFAGAFHAVPVTDYPKILIDEMVSQAERLSSKLMAKNNVSFVSVGAAVEPFFDQFSHSRGGAYPHDPARQVTPVSTMLLYVENPGDSEDVRLARFQKFKEAIRHYSRSIQAVAVEQGVSRWDDVLYPNYAQTDTPLGLLYGENVQRLRDIAAKYDADRIMSLTGGFRFQD